jgi:uncharacterized protein YndB with AHSA1/START domain
MRSMSNEVTVTKVINAPASEVFEMVSHLERMGEWSPENTGGKWVKGATGPAVGAKFEGTNANEKTTWKTLAIVTDMSKPTGFGFRVVVGPVKVAKWSWAIESTNDSSCRVSHSWTDQRSALAKFLGKLSTGISDRSVHNKTVMTTTLDRLAAAAER